MLTPAPEANRTTLIRRLALDLTGLPPTPAQVGAFLADTSSDAYERVVDRLLQSPHYGERMAVDWLDAAPVRAASPGAISETMSIRVRQPGQHQSASARMQSQQ